MKEYKTQNIHEAVALHTAGHTGVRTEIKTSEMRGGVEYGIFVFYDTKELRADLFKWETGELKGSARRYADTLRAFKSWIYDKMKKPPRD